LKKWLRKDKEPLRTVMHGIFSIKLCFRNFNSLFTSYRFWKAGIYNKPFLIQSSGQYKGYPLRYPVGFRPTFRLYLFNQTKCGLFHNFTFKTAIMAIAKPFNLNAWINESRHLLKPPVENKIYILSRVIISLW
jgi:hypothetical protein